MNDHPPGFQVVVQNFGDTHYVRFQVLASVTMKITVSWGVTACSLVDIYQCFR
jgi:hypothetical protein